MITKLGIKILSAGILFVLAYWPVFVWMWDRWWARDSYYSHGILIPIVSGILIWQDRKRFSNLTFESSPWGLWLFIVGILLHFISLLFRVYFTSAFSMLLVLAGMILIIGGRQAFQRLLFPLLFLSFMIPLPLVAIINMSFQLKMFAAQLATGILNLVGIPAMEQGSYIRMRHSFVIVEDVCSGLRSIIALLALGSLFAHWLKASFIKKLILFASAIPIAVLTNALRITFLAVVAEFWGVEYLNTIIHSLAGFLVFALACVFLYVVAELLS